MTHNTLQIGHIAAAARHGPTAVRAQTLIKLQSCDYRATGSAYFFPKSGKHSANDLAGCLLSECAFSCVSLAVIMN